MGKLSDGLKKYFEETPKEIIEKDWKEIKHLNKIGPDVIEMLKGLSKNRKPFSIKDAKNGALVYTRNNRKAEILKFDAEGDYPIIALTHDDEGNEVILRFTKGGKYYNDDLDNKFDLFIDCNGK